LTTNGIHSEAPLPCIKTKVKSNGMYTTEESVSALFKTVRYRLYDCIAAVMALMQFSFNAV
jgi:hypothetical protein